eukprot:gnl/Chilomastix_cuspidata/1053.p1 GENE.gnl/Chilomastix_cuspidata/1053~~gnl/Chilomastix_cuspidata/1053.p1  ORF type:complete len:473 (-),score=168.43 gnl/Chilomastix_cuspidata/1053:73-1491(-)
MGFEQDPVVYKEKLQKELNALVEQKVMNPRAAVECSRLYCRYHQQLLSKTDELDWDAIKKLPPEFYLEPTEDTSKLSDDTIKSLLGKVVILNLNGGIGTSMKCSFPKSTLRLKDDLSFIHIALRQAELLNDKYGVDIPFLYMNSGRTDSETKKFVEEANPDKSVTVHHFIQPVFPRLDPTTLLPVTHLTPDDCEYWYPPGHASVFASLQESGLIDDLLARGKRWVLISNADNLGASPDPQFILALEKQLEREDAATFFIEVTPKTAVDVKGGTPVLLDGAPFMLEVGQVPAEHLREFKDLGRFPVFNTGNTWVYLPAWRDQKNFDLPIIANPKNIDGHDVLQLEMAAGSALRIFPSRALLVHRRRFIPVKTTDDLLRLQSDVYALQPDFSVAQTVERLPRITLGPEFKGVKEYRLRMQGVPSCRLAEEVRLDGDITVGRDVSFIGRVCIVSKKGPRVLRDGETFRDYTESDE